MTIKGQIMKKPTTIFLIVIIAVILAIITLLTYESYYIIFLACLTLSIYYMVYLFTVFFKALSGEEGGIDQIAFKDFSLKGQTVSLIASFIIVFVIHIVTSYDLSEFVNNQENSSLDKIDDDNIFVIGRNTLLPVNLVNGDKILLKKVDSRTFNRYSIDNKIVPILSEKTISIYDTREEISYGSFESKKLNDLDLQYFIDVEILTLSFDPGIEIRNNHTNKTVKFSDDLSKIPFKLEVKQFTDNITQFDIVNAITNVVDEEEVKIINRGAYPYHYEDRHFLILVIEANHDEKKIESDDFYSRFALLEIVNKDVLITEEG